MTDEAKVNRCECANKTFAQLKAYENLAAAQAETSCGVECEGCLPYLKLMFASGETEFDLEDPRLKEFE
jgi:hypothetical protein